MDSEEKMYLGITAIVALAFISIVAGITGYNIVDRIYAHTVVTTTQVVTPTK